MAFEWPLWSSFVPDQWCLPWLSREETGSEWRGEMLQATKGVSKVFFPSYSSTLGSSGHHKSCLNLLFRAPPLCVCLCVYERERERACVFISPLQILLLKWLDNFVRHPRLPRSSAFLYYSFPPPPVGDVSSPVSDSSVFPLHPVCAQHSENTLAKSNFGAVIFIAS